MSERNLTAGALRAITLAARLAQEWNHSQTQPGHLLWALMSEESQAFERLRQRGLTTESVVRESLFARDALAPLAQVPSGERDQPGVRGDCKEDPVSEFPSPPAPLPGVPGRGEPNHAGAAERSTDEIVDVLSTARILSQLEGRHAEVSTEHLLAALVRVESPVKDLLVVNGFGEQQIGRAHV